MIEFFYHVDLQIFYFFNHNLSFPFLDRFFSIITNVNNWYIAYVILLLISFWKGGIKGKFAVPGVILLIIFTDQLNHQVIKELFERIRPCNALNDAITPLGCTGTFSFPSNHAVNNFAAAFFYFILFPKLKWALFIPAFLVSVSRIYLGLHFPSDVLAGAILGSIFGYIFALGTLKIVLVIENKNKERLMPANKKISLRKSTDDDVKLIFSFIKELSEYEKLDSELTATEENLKESLFGKNKCAEVFIAEYENKPAGQVLFFYNFSTFKGKPGIYIEDIYVKPEFRGKGIGNALFTKIIELAKEKNCGRIEWVVLDWNKPAINFYDNLGAEPLNNWITYRLSEEKFKLF